MHQSPRMIETWWDKSWKRLKRRPVSDSGNKSTLHQVLHWYFCFIFLPFQTSGHYVEIRVQSLGSCLQWGRPRFSAAVYTETEPSQDQKFILKSSYRMADKRSCWAKNKGGLLHELFHLFGIMHTQMRPDRDEHITVLSQNIQRSYSREYDVSKSRIDPIDCKSSFFLDMSWVQKLWCSLRL